MAINFPSSPTTNDLYVYGGVTYQYDGEKWIIYAGVNSNVWQRISGAAVSGSPATIDFTGLDTLGYLKFRLEVINIRPATDAVALRMRVGTGATPTWVTGADYDFTGTDGDSTSITSIGNLDEDAWMIADPIGNANNENCTAIMEFTLGGSNIYPSLISSSFQVDGFTLPNGKWVNGLVISTAASAVRIYLSSGNFANVGSYALYGLKG